MRDQDTSTLREMFQFSSLVKNPLDQCSFLFEKMSIGKFNLQVSFSLGLFELHFSFLIYIWVGVDCRPVSQQIYVLGTRMWLEKTLPIILLMKKNKYLEDTCSMNGWSDKKAILSFFSRHNLTALHTKFHICQIPVHVFCK